MMRDPLYLRCHCHQPNHFVLVEDDPDIAGVINLSLVASKSARFWHRVRWALAHVFGGEHLTIGDVIMANGDVERLQAFLATRDSA